MLDQVVCEGRYLSMERLGQLDRPAYLALDAVLREAGGKWMRATRVHVFEDDAAPIVDRLLLTREIASAKRIYQQYDTPAHVANEMIDRAKIKRGMLALEPSMGLGIIAFEMRRRGALVSGYEIDPQRQYLVSYNMDRRAFNTPFQGCICGDFLSAEPNPIFDRVVMNPPFRMSQDIAHVSHALDFLKPGGRLVSILSNSAFTRQTKAHQNFRAKLDTCRYEYSLTPIEAGAFRDAATMVPTTMLVLEHIRQD